MSIKDALNQNGYRRRVAIRIGGMFLLLVVLVFWATKGAYFKSTDAALKADNDTVFEFAAGDVARVTRTKFARSIILNGSLDPFFESTVKAAVSGQVQRVLVREGEPVRQGAVVVQLDAADTQARLDAAMADQAERQARRDIAARNLESNRELLNRGFISQNAFDQLLSNLEASSAALRWADAQVRLARQALADTVVRAPINSNVARRMVNDGERVGVDAALLQLVDLSRMELKGSIPVSDASRVAPGQKVRFHVDGFGTREFAGTVARINPVAENGSRVVKVFVIVPNADAALRGGMFAQGAVQLTGGESALSVPATAVFEEAGQSYLFAIEAKKLVKVPVTVGARDDRNGLIAISGAVGEGLQVVQVRMAGLKAGARVVMADSDAAPGSASGS